MTESGATSLHSPARRERKEYRVRAQGVSVNTLISGDASYSNIALLTWGIVPKPEVSASGGNQQVNLRWRDPGNPDITKWQVQQDDGVLGGH